MVEIELDGAKVSVPEGSMVMHAADKAGTYIPHFCYHKKLSIAANCRMCLVDIEKAPKPMPACATPVTAGMIVRTRSDKAVKAQQSVMEFLLINHPLDCPICDQGGECQLQDLAVGYGKSASRYTEEKRVVLSKDVGPLIGMEEMTRCIHCTRCVRFGQEVAGIMELGMIDRGEHAEITTVAGDTIDSELSGNMIDLCPVGALTSKPFRYSARTWELSRRKSISPHDSTGSNLIVQVKAGRVMRVLPLENEAVNECWLADSERFSYEGLNTDERLTTPMLKQGGQWQAVDWTTALQYVASGLQGIAAEHGPQAIGALATPHATVEELHLLAKLVRALGSDNIDHRLRHADTPPAEEGAPVRWLGTSIASLTTLDRAFVIGSFLRKDHALFAQRLRQAAKRGAAVSSLHALADDWLMPVKHSLVAAPGDWVAVLSDVAAAVAEAAGVEAPFAGEGGATGSETGSAAGGDAARLDSAMAPDRSAQRDAARAIAASLRGGQKKAVLLGNAAVQHPDAEMIRALARFIAEHTGASCGELCEAANSVGAQLVGAQPRHGGLGAAQMLGGGAPCKALLLLHAEPLLDAADPARAAAALAGAQMVVSMSPFETANREHADVLLPIAPFTETAGSFVNAEGRLQSFHGVAKPRGETRPGWKVLRVLGNILGLPGFDGETAEEVRGRALGGGTGIGARLTTSSPSPQPSPRSTGAREQDRASVEQRASEAGSGAASSSLSRLRERAGVRAAASPSELQRIADIPIYSADAILRRSPPLQATADARPPRAGLPSALWQRLNLSEGDSVHVQQGSASVRLPAYLDATLAPNCVRVPAGHPATAVLGAMFGPIAVERAS